MTPFPMLKALFALMLINAKLHLFEHLHPLINPNFMLLNILKISDQRRCLNHPLSLPYLSPPISYNRVLLRFSSDKHRSKDCLNNTRWKNQSRNVNWDNGARGDDEDLLPYTACSFGNINVLLFVRPINRITEK